MSTNSNLDRIAEAWLAEGPTQLADRVLEAALDEVHLTRQRRRLPVPWRFNTMPTPLRLAAAALIGVVALGVIYLNLPGRSDVGGPPPTPAPTGTAAATSSAPTASEAVPPEDTPALTQRFTSTIHAIALLYPDGWVTRAATQPWTTRSVPYFGEDSVDVMYDPALTDHMFLAVASQSHAGKTREAWATALAASQEGCEIELMEWDGGTAWIARTCRLFLVAESDIGWVIRMYAPDLPPALDPAYDRLFERILGTVQLHARPPNG